MEYYSSLDASQLDSDTPTIFELISSKQLDGLLSPSLRYILVYYASRYPYYLLKVVNNFDELNLVVKGFVEWYFLKYWQGSFTESFYGLKRVRRTALDRNKFESTKLIHIAPSLTESTRSLSRIQVLASVFEIAGSAYASDKLNYWYEIWYPKYIVNGLAPTNPDSKREKLICQSKVIFLKVFPFLQSSIKALNLIITLLYLSGQTKSSSIIMTLFKMNYSRLNQYDYDKYEQKLTSSKKKLNYVTPETSSTLLTYILRRFILRPSWRGSKYFLGTLFPAAIFSLKFIEWYNSTNFAQKLAKSSGSTLDSILPAPSLLQKIVNQKSLHHISPRMYKSTDLCPLCEEKIENPAAIETGYVFCYTCIYNFLADSHKIIGKKEEKVEETESSDDEDEDSEAVLSGKNKEKTYDIVKGGRCPITGRKLLGCKWNSLKEAWDIDGIRRLIL